MDREAQQATVHGVTKSQTRLKQLSTHTCYLIDVLQRLFLLNSLVVLKRKYKCLHYANRKPMQKTESPALTWALSLDSEFRSACVRVHFSLLLVHRFSPISRRSGKLYLSSQAVQVLKKGFCFYWILNTLSHSSEFRCFIITMKLQEVSKQNHYVFLLCIYRIARTVMINEQP